MPNRTVYVAEADLPLYQRAQELAGGNLSAAIAQALGRFVEVRELGAKGMEEVTVSVGAPGRRRRQRFVGVRLATWKHPVAGNAREQVWRAYRTGRGRIAVHEVERPNWGWKGWYREEGWDDPARYTGDGDLWEEGEATLHVFDSVEAMGDAVPAPLREAIVEALDRPAVEDLDI